MWRRTEAALPRGIEPLSARRQRVRDTSRVRKPLVNSFARVYGPLVMSMCDVDALTNRATTAGTRLNAGAAERIRTSIVLACGATHGRAKVDCRGIAPRWAAFQTAAITRPAHSPCEYMKSPRPESNRRVPLTGWDARPSSVEGGVGNGAVRREGIAPSWSCLSRRCVR